MLARLTAMWNQGKEKATAFLKKFRLGSSPSKVCCIELSMHDFSLITANVVANPIQIQSCDTYPFGDSKGFQKALELVIKDRNMEGMFCYWVLKPEQYQLIPMDALPLKDNDLRAAIRWKIKEFSNFSAEDALIDSFPIPKRKQADAKNTMMVVLAQRSYLQIVNDEMREAGLKLKGIYIQELSLLNLMSIYEKDDKGIVLVYIRERKTQLLISRKKELFFARYFEFGLEQLTTTPEESIPTYLDQFVLEIMRSIDYYQSQWRNPTPSKIMFSYVTQPSYDIMTYLSQRLTLPTEVIHLSDKLQCPQDMDSTKLNKYLVMVGALFQEEKNNYVTTN